MEFVKPGGKIPFRRVHAVTPEIRQLQDSIIDLVKHLEERFAASYFQGIPIGVPFPFLQARMPSTFTLGEKFLPCDGRRIVMQASPLDGQSTPVLADALGGTETLTWYVRVVD